MLQCGPESFFRELVVPATSRSRGQKVQKVGALGVPPRETRVDTAAGIFKARSMGEPTTIEIFDQLVIHDEKDEPHFIELNTKMKSAVLRNKVKLLNINKIKDARVHCENKSYPTYETLIKEAWPNSKIENLPNWSVGRYQVSCEEIFRVTDHYYRAIAKIAFHYYLVHSQKFRGNEQHFAPIRDFIINGGNPYTFFLKQKIRKNLSIIWGPSRWFHELSAIEGDDRVIASVCLFRGPRNPWGIEHRLVLGNPPHSLIVMLQTAWKNYFVYDRHVPKTGKVGIVVTG